MIKCLFPILLFGSVYWCCGENENAMIVYSPNGELQISVLEQDNYFNYQVFFDGKKIISKSKLGLIFKNGQVFPSSEYTKHMKTRSYQNNWELPWGETKKIQNKFNEAKVTFKNYQNNKIGDMFFRVYNDGVAFRYYVESAEELEDTITIVNEITQFNLVEDGDAWWVPAYTENRYEHLYTKSKISEMDTVHTPLTIRYNNNVHLSIHEADLVNYSSMQLYSNDTTINCDLAPWSNGDKVRTRLPFKSPWRTIIVAKEAKDLITSNLTLNCNEPSLVDDVSWIQPSKYIGIWWGMILGKWTWGEGLRHGATNERAKDYINFASDHGFDEVLIEGWSSGWKGLFPEDSVTISFTKSTPDIDIKELQKYAKSKDVSLQLYHETSGNTKNYLAQIDSAFSFLNELDIRNVKIGHVGAKLDKKEYHYSQYGVNYFRKVLKKALKYKIGINFHEPVKDTGERRTYPNMLTREGARGMEYNAWPGGNPPNHTLILPFTRLLSSPMDFTPGIFDLLLDNIENHDNIEFPVTISVIDSGNGYHNLRFKSSETIWIDKKMKLDTTVVKNGKKINIWTIQQQFQIGEWEWGVTADHQELGKSNIWIIESLLDKSNRTLTVGNQGNIIGKDKIYIPFQDLKNFGPDFIKGYPATSIQRVSTTLTKQLALYVIINSPLQMASDFIDNYNENAAFRFIMDVPVTWDTTIVLGGEIEKHLTIARKDRNSKDWYIGAITNESSRSFEFELCFLDEGNYEAIIYSDSKDADWQLNPYLYNVSKKYFTNSDKIRIDLMNGGGQAIKLIYLD